MTLAAAILAAMATLPCPRDESAETCAEWRPVVAEAIAEASERATCTSEWSSAECTPIWRGSADELAAVLAEVAYHESGLRRRIQAGECRRDECDSTWRWLDGKRVHTGYLARSLWQLHRSPAIPGIEPLLGRESWIACTGTEYRAVAHAALTAARVLARSPRAFGVTLGSKGPRGRATWRILARIRGAQ